VRRKLAEVPHGPRAYGDERIGAFGAFPYCVGRLLVSSRPQGKQHGGNLCPGREGLSDAIAHGPFGVRIENHCQTPAEAEPAHELGLGTPEVLLDHDRPNPDGDRLRRVGAGESAGQDALYKL
jgi:hypothetical protein